MRTYDSSPEEGLASAGRRDFIKSTAVVGGGLVLGFYLPGTSRRAEAAAGSYAPTAWVKIGADNTVTIVCARSEMGQGVYTAMPQLVAEELEVDPHAVKVEIAPPGAVYVNELLGGQITGGSTSVRDGWTKLRQAGAQARMMLVGAAAQTWGVDEASCRAENGVVIHSSGRKLAYGQVAEKAAGLPAPKDVKLKSPGEFKIVGKPIKRLDTPAKVDGTAEFGIDVKLPGMLYASLAQCPVIGGKAAGVDDSKARSMPGVRHVVRIDDGVAVVAESWWQARVARDALQITWDEGKGAALNNRDIMAGIKAAAAGPGAVIKKVGDADAAMGSAVKKVEAAYELPFLAHATMEPMNFTADVKVDRCDLYGPTQFQQLAQGLAAQAAGVPAEKVSLHTPFLGGGFGRRIDVDYIVQAVQISKAAGAPVKLVWTREDDMTHDFYRPMSYHQMSAGLDGQGRPVAMKFQATSPSVTSRLFPSVVSKEGVDPFMTEAAVIPYDIPNLSASSVIHDTGLRVGYWRSVSHAANTFANESFIDELAAAAGKDPYEYRRMLLDKEPRFRNVLDIAARNAGWGQPPPAGRSRGIALMSGYDSYLAEVAEISVARDGGIRVHRVVCAVDPGMMVNPDIVKAQIEGSVVFGLTAALKGEITLQNGRVQQTNFDSYPMLRMNEMPKIDIYLVASGEKPGGTGEPATALIGPAVANAVFAATGKRIRRLPIRAQDLKSA
ncbi:MAG: aldehyde oxidase [Acidobacteria bacterium]|nr:MAG: aldehyde oxidase [Acidobacteriota bacterium]